LHEEAGVADEGDAEFSIGGETRFVSFAAARSDCGVADETSELGGALTQGRITERLFNHPATEPRGGILSGPSMLVLFGAVGRLIKVVRRVF